MKVRELIAQLSEYDGELDVILEFSEDAYAYIDDVDGAVIEKRAFRPRRDWGGSEFNAVRICG